MAQVPNFANLEQFSQILLCWAGLSLWLAPITIHCAEQLGLSTVGSAFTLHPLELWRVRGKQCYG